MMKAKRPRRLVVDACVLGSATVSGHPVSRCCLAVLFEIYEICHRVVITPAIQEEWNHHTPRQAYKWRGSMMRRGKFVRLQESEMENWDLPAGFGSESERAALLKDLHLIKAAVAADGIIIIQEVELPALWGKYGRHFKLSKPIKWLNPTKDSVESLRNL